MSALEQCTHSGCVQIPGVPGHRAASLVIGIEHGSAREPRIDIAELVVEPERDISPVREPEKVQPSLGAVEDVPTFEIVEMRPCGDRARCRALAVDPGDDEP